MIAVGDDESKIELLGSILKSAVWTMRLAATGSATSVECPMDLSTDLLHAPITLLLKLNAKAIATDLQFLSLAIENGELAKRESQGLTRATDEVLLRSRSDRQFRQHPFETRYCLPDQRRDSALYAHPNYASHRH